MKNIRTLNSRQAAALILMGVLIVALQVIYYFLPQMMPSGEFKVNEAEISAIKRKMDSLQWVKQKIRDSIRPFNPSFITPYKAAKLGLNAEQTKRLLAHRKAGKYINSVREFKEVTGVSDSLLAGISPYFKFPDWVLRKQKKLREKSFESKPGKENPPVEKIIPADINSVTREQLMKIKGIGEALSNRIIKYRAKLGGYSFDDQLYEVWGLSRETADRVLRYYHVMQPPRITKININTARFKEVLHLPYMDYELTKKIFEYRDEVAEIQSLDELKKIKDFPQEKFDRISLYLKAE